MQVDAETTAWIGAISGIATALATGLGTHLVTREKVNRLEKDVEALEVKQQRFITSSHFEMVVDSMRETLIDVQADIKVILGNMLR